MVGPRVLAVVGAVTSAVLWGYLIWTIIPGGSEALPPAIVAGVLFPGLAWAGAVALWRDAPIVTIITGVIGILPVGLYFLPAPGVLKLLGVAPILTLVAGIWGIRRLGDPALAD